MIDTIKEKFTEIASKCTNKYAKENATQQKNVQLVFKLSKDKEDSEYLIYKDYKPLKELTFLQVLCVPIDLKGYSLFVPKFIRGALMRFCGEFEIESDKVRTMITFDERGQMFMFLYNGSQFVKQVELESLFDVSDLVTE
jgi:hypothetical protein